jgi:phosphoribosylformimino-5-aminoimidazole carboxamide ribotide isomerase
MTQCALSDVGSSEFLIHAADVEGLCQGIDEKLVMSKYRSADSRAPITHCYPELGEWAKIPTTYAGGAKGIIGRSL